MCDNLSIDISQFKFKCWIVFLNARAIVLNRLPQRAIVLNCLLRQAILWLQWAIELSSALDLADKSGTASLYLEYFYYQVHSSTSGLLRLKIWSTVAVSQCRTRHAIALSHNSAEKTEKLLKEHCLSLEMSLNRSWPWWIVRAIDRIALDMIDQLKKSNINVPADRQLNSRRLDQGHPTRI